MKRIATTGVWIFAILLFAGMTGRALWLASRTATGLQTLKQQWMDSTIGVVLGRRVPIHSREPTEQAEYWLSEVDRVLNGESKSAELAIGAALVLDSPCPDFITKYVKSIDTFPGAGVMPSLDDEGIKRTTDAFELKCKQRCLELATAATKLEPENAEWWRLRALLLWRYSIHSYDSTPRDPNWPGILNECAQHDPNNALYDYLAAFFYWESSAEQDISENDDRLVIKNNERFNRGIELFHKGQAKAFFAVGDAGFSAVAKFLNHTQIPLSEQANVVNSRSIHLRRSILLRDVSRWQGLRADEQVATGNIKTGLVMHRENLRVFEQFTGAGASTANDNIALACRIATTSQMAAVANKHKDVLTADSIREITKLREQAKIDEAVLQRAALALTTGKATPTAGLTVNSSPSVMVLAMAASMFVSVATVLFLLGVISILLAYFINGPDRTKIGLVGHTLAILTAFAVTITVFGLAPAKIINQDMQSRALTILVILTPIILLSWIVWVWVRRRAFQYSLRALLVSVLAVCLLLTLIYVTRPVALSFTTFPFDFAIPALGLEAWDASGLENVLRPLGSWVWAVFQWTAYHGQYLTIALWVCFVAVLLNIKIQFEQCKIHNAAPTFQDRISALFRSLGLSSITIMALALIAYLAIVPSVVDTIEQDCQSKTAFARHPDEHWSRVQQAVQSVRNDGAMMNELKKSVAAELSEAAQGEVQ